MQKKLHKFFQYWHTSIIHPDLRKSEYLYQKAVILSNVLLLLSVFSIFIIYSHLFLIENNPLSTYSPLIASILMLIIFRKFGNLSLSGNVLAGAFMLALTPATFESGGLYSDNLLWMGAAPFIAFLFATRFSGMVWLFVLEMVTLVLYTCEINSTVSYREQMMHSPPEYFWVSWSLLFAVFTYIVYLFAKGEFRIVTLLQNNELKLTKQKDRLSKQANALKKNEIQLKELNKNMEHFVYAVSHDLKEPLRMIRMYTQLLNKSLGSQLTPTNSEFMAYVLDGTDRMQQMLEGLLHYSRLGKIEENGQEVNLEDIIIIVKNNLAFSIKAHDAQVVTSGNLPTIKAHSTFVMQLFQNLISNAIKFHHKDRQPVISIKCRESAGGYTINVEDNGIGIAEEFQSRIFEIFTKLHHHNEYEGSGIGLATCKKIVSNMGGTISLKSVVGEGTTFRIWIPKQGSPEEMNKKELTATLYN